MLQRWLPMPEIEMHCRKEGEVRRFATSRKLWIYGPDSSIELFHFFTYKCRNCGDSAKTIAIALEVRLEERGDVEVMKLGEYPPFAAPITTKLRGLLDDAAGLFEQGWHCERSGFGIGAAAYYRRVVELKWKTLVQAMKSAAEAINASPEMLARFEQALRQTQFSRAVDLLKDGFPDQLYALTRENPISLLYNSLSLDIHTRSDSQCLEIAGATRKVLQAMVETLERVQKEHNMLKEAVKKLQP